MASLSCHIGKVDVEFITDLVLLKLPLWFHLIPQMSDNFGSTEEIFSFVVKKATYFFPPKNPNGLNPPLPSYLSINSAKSGSFLIGSKSGSPRTVL